MTFALDTSILISLERKDKETVESLKGIGVALAERNGIPSPAYSEFYLGCLNRGQKLRENAIGFLDSFELLNTTKGSSLIFAEIKNQAEETGKNVPTMDLLIASIVIANRATLLTRDRDFEKIKGLDVVVI